jgi:DNA-binding NarL/FixJ family response regulator
VAIQPEAGTRSDPLHGGRTVGCPLGVITASNSTAPAEGGSTTPVAPADVGELVFGRRELSRRCRAGQRVALGPGLSGVTDLRGRCPMCRQIVIVYGVRAWDGAIIVDMAESCGRVVVAEDDVLLREGLASLLVGAGFDIVGRFGTYTELMAHVLQLNPDLVIVDIRMPPTHTTEGLDAARTIRQELPDTAIMVLSGHVQVEQATELLRGGQRMGYLLKDRVSDVEDFLSTLDRVIKGASVVDPALVQELLAARRVEDPLQPLSPREREVLALMAEGLSNAGIARRLWLAEGTIEKHVRSILTKLGIAEATESHRRVLAVLTFLGNN